MWIVKHALKKCNVACGLNEDDPKKTLGFGSGNGRSMK